MKTYEKYLIKEHGTFTYGYDDGSMAGDDDYPTGNILMGDKYKKVPYHNRLNQFNVNWVVDQGEWQWAKEFDAASGQDSTQNYHDTITGGDSVLYHRLFRHMHDGEPREVPRYLRALGNDLGPYTDSWGKPADDDDYEKTGDTSEVEPDNTSSQFAREIDKAVGRMQKRIAAYIDKYRSEK